MTKAAVALALTLASPAWAEVEPGPATAQPSAVTLEPLAESPPARSQFEMKLPTDTQYWEADLSLAVPTPINLGFTRRVNPKTEFEISGGYFGLSFGAERAIHTWNMDLASRWHPWAGPFYLGLAARYLHLGVDVPVPIDSTIGSRANSTLGLEGLYVIPAVGWTWMASSSMTIGMDIGVQLPVLTRGSITSSDDGNALAANGQAMIDSLSRNSVRAASYFSRFPLPNITLFRLGWKI